MMNESNTLTRREALFDALKGVAMATVVAPIIVDAAPAAPKPEFVPENDYPYFGYEPDLMP